MPSKDTQFKPGEVNNPKGRPIGTGFRDVIRRLGQELTEVEGRKMTRTEASVYASFKLAETGDIPALRFLAQHSEGTKADVTSGDEPIDVVVVYIPDNGRDETKQEARCHSVLE